MLSTQYYKLSPPITACVFSATQALSHLFKRRVDSVTERSYPKSHTVLGIRTHQVALWQCKAWYLLTSQWEDQSNNKKNYLVSFEAFSTSTHLLKALYIGSRSPNHGKWQASCTAALVVFLISDHCSRLYLLFGPWQAERQRMLMNVFAASTIWEASRFHFLSYKSWVLNSGYAIKMKFPVKLWTLPFVQVVERYRFATSQANPHSLKC